MDRVMGVPLNVAVLFLVVVVNAASVVTAGAVAGAISRRTVEASSTLRGVRTTVAELESKLAADAIRIGDLGVELDRERGRAQRLADELGELERDITAGERRVVALAGGIARAVGAAGGIGTELDSLDGAVLRLERALAGSGESGGNEPSGKGSGGSEGDASRTTIEPRSGS